MFNELKSFTVSVLERKSEQKKKVLGMKLGYSPLHWHC